MAHCNANRHGRTGGEDRRSSPPRPAKRAAKQAPIAEGGSAAGVAARRRPACVADGEPAGGLDDGGGQPRRADTRTGAALDLEALDILIVQQWTKTLRGPYDWGDWPLARYTLGAGVLRMAQPAGASARCTSPAATHLAWVCAMVACGRASRLRSLAPSPLLGAGEEQLVRPDGACGWRCNIERDAPDGPQLHYWIHPSGLVEFDTVSSEDERCRA